MENIGIFMSMGIYKKNSNLYNEVFTFNLDNDQVFQAVK